MKEIKLTQNKYALVDDENFEKLNKHKWYAFRGEKVFYAGRKKKIDGKTHLIIMHRIINKTPKGKETDHINGNGLDNRRKNLRSCSHQQNAINRGLNKNNTSGYKGVSWSKKLKKWRVYIWNKNQIWLGTHSTRTGAYKLYLEACKKHYGAFTK